MLATGRSRASTITKSVFGRVYSYYSLPPSRVASQQQRKAFLHQWVRIWRPRRLVLRGVLRKNQSNSPRPGQWNIWLVLGFYGTIGGGALSLIKYLSSDRTSTCKSSQGQGRPKKPAPTTSAEVAVNDFGLLQRFHLLLRFVSLCVVFSPALVLYGWSYILGSTTLAHYSWNYVLFALQKAGPAFVKLGQWASTRRDLFSEDFCATLTHLHLHCNTHSWEETEKQLEKSFGENWQERVVIDDHVPIGSGCVAQVYQGRLCCHGNGVLSTDAKVAKPLPIAVKVLHPNIVERMQQDIYLMKYISSWVDTLYPDVHWVAFTDCVDEFSSIMEKQLDLKHEAENLCKFKAHMTDSAHIKFPAPLYPYVTKEVLVETFESGDQITEYLDHPGGEIQKSLAKFGIEALFDMLFVHNFVHGDLHPGNILVQDSGLEEVPTPRLVLLDCGIATSLDAYNLENFHCVFTAIVRGEGEKVADLFLDGQECSTLEEYRKSMGALIRKAIQNFNLQEVHVDTLFADLFNILIEHKVRIDPTYTSVMVAMMVIEGLGRSLDPSLDILEYARPCVLKKARRSIQERVAQRLHNISGQRVTTEHS